MLFLLLFFILFSVCVSAGPAKKCTSSFQNESGDSDANKLFDQKGQKPSKPPKRTQSVLSASELLKILNSSSSSVADRKKAVQQSILLTGARGVTVLEKALDDVSVEVRTTAVQVAINMGEVALSVLSKAIVDSSPEVRQELIRSAKLMSDRLIIILKENGLQVTFKTD